MARRPPRCARRSIAIETMYGRRVSKSVVQQQWRCLCTDTLQDKIIRLANHRGFVFPGSQLYGGLANSYDYGPLGVQMKKNILDKWWKDFVVSRRDIVGLDSSIIL